MSMLCSGVGVANVRGYKVQALIGEVTWFCMLQRDENEKFTKVLVENFIEGWKS